MGVRWGGCDASGVIVATPLRQDEDAPHVACAPGGRSAVVMSGGLDEIVLLQLPGLAAVDTRQSPGLFGHSVLVNHAGDRVFTRDSGFLDAFTYDSSTGAFGAAPLFSTSIADTLDYVGMEQMALHPNDTRLYVSKPGGLAVFDANAGALLRTIPLAAAHPTGVCLTPAPAPNRPPSCALAVARPGAIWPPDHAMVPLGVTGLTDPDGDAVTLTATSVLQDEPVQARGSGSGHPAPDAILSPLQVRAERDGTGDGRVYHVASPPTTAAAARARAT